MTTSAPEGIRLSRIWSERTLRGFLVSQGLSLFGNAMASIVVAFAALDLGGSAAALSAVLIARYVPLAVFVLVGGVFGDRLCRRQIMIWSDLVRALSQGCLAGLLLLGEARLWQLVLLQALYGGAEAFFNPARRGLVPHLVPASLLQRANALLLTSDNISRIAGPALGVLLAELTSPGGVLAIDAATFVISAALLARLRIPEVVTPDTSRQVRADLLGGWSELRIRTWLRVSILNFTVFSALALPALWVLGPELARVELGGASGWAVLTGAFGAGSVAGGLATFRIRPLRPAAACAALLGIAALRPAVLVSGCGVPILAGYSFVAGVAMSAAGVLWVTLVQDHIPRDTLSRVSSVDEFASIILTPAGYLLAGSLAATVGLQIGMVLLAVVAVAVSLGTAVTPGVRRLGWADAAPAKGR
jgi:MFS family permease